MVPAYASLAMICGLAAAVVSAQSQEIRVIVRGDDLGMTQGSLTAFERAVNSGVRTTAGIIVPGPWFEAAAELARRNPGWCTGIHLCLVGEWRGFRWRPVLPWDKVRSIVDEDGYLHTSPRALFAARPKLEEIDAELRAQIELAKKRGVNVQYLDLHYVALTQYPGLEGVVKKIASDYDLPLSGQLGEKRTPSIYNAPIEEKLPSQDSERAQTAEPASRQAKPSSSCRHHSILSVINNCA